MIGCLKEVLIHILIDERFYTFNRVDGGNTKQLLSCPFMSTDVIHMFLQSLIDILPFHKVNLCNDENKTAMTTLCMADE